MTDQDPGTSRVRPFLDHHAELREGSDPPVCGVCSWPLEWNRKHGCWWHSMRSSVWIAVLLRDQGDLCWLCTCPMVPGDITIDHLHPKSHDGPDELSNLRLAHRACNVARGDLPVVETARALIGVRRIPSQVRRALREALMSWRDL